MPSDHSSYAAKLPVLLCLAILTTSSPALNAQSWRHTGLTEWCWLLNYRAGMTVLRGLIHRTPQSGTPGGFRYRLYRPPSETRMLPADASAFINGRWRSTEALEIGIQHSMGVTQYECHSKRHHRDGVRTPGTPDQPLLDECLSETNNFDFPVSLPDTHSLASVLTTLVANNFQVAHQMLPQTPILSQSLYLHGMYSPDISPVHSITYSQQGDYLDQPDLLPVTKQNRYSLIALNIPHPGAAGAIRIGRRYAIATVNNRRTLLILIPHIWLVTMNFITGQCSENKNDIYDPRRWDKDGHDDQSNDFPAFVK